MLSIKNKNIFKYSNVLYCYTSACLLHLRQSCVNAHRYTTAQQCHTFTPSALNNFPDLTAATIRNWSGFFDTEAFVERSVYGHR